MKLPDLSVWCDKGVRFTWLDGRDEHNQLKLGKARADPLNEAADLIARRFRQVHSYQPARGRTARP
ncbi:hypothetical protein AB0C10_16090 [Microbispora amethystogenes]|uniref:hypothetical protein n=1 Tax=Microbispora amethystogenes TaxID=1427754 RepID=UPI0033F2DF13